MHQKLLHFQRAVLERHSTNYQKIEKAIMAKRKKEGHNAYMPEGVSTGGLGGTYEEFDNENDRNKIGVLQFKKVNHYPIFDDECFDFFKHRDRKRNASEEHIYNW